jgi:hypothetical protein
LCHVRFHGAENNPAPGCEYVRIRWDGRDNTHLIRRGGQVEFVGVELRKVPRPDRTDDRAFYLNVVMNGLAKEGYEFAGMAPDETIMKRTVAR